ncbi:hypothetical protein PR048_020323 [Dryococelus australis]|uniref:Uncharacterized protein n=1 Tax=Dryococelus australis TaxID=614101 RepID=A0ABQ9H633_9NEOP|nr:hypothetical protein PR048_020323 [Dryococelus australis]
MANGTTVPQPLVLVLGHTIPIYCGTFSPLELWHSDEVWHVGYRCCVSWTSVGMKLRWCNIAKTVHIGPDPRARFRRYIPLPSNPDCIFGWLDGCPFQGHTPHYRSNTTKTCSAPHTRSAYTSPECVFCWLEDCPLQDHTPPPLTPSPEHMFSEMIAASARNGGFPQDQTQFNSAHEVYLPGAPLALPRRAYVRSAPGRPPSGRRTTASVQFSGWGGATGCCTRESLTCDRADCAISRGGGPRHTSLNPFIPPPQPLRHTCSSGARDHVGAMCAGLVEVPICRALVKSTLRSLRSIPSNLFDWLYKAHSRGPPGKSCTSLLEMYASCPNCDRILPDILTFVRVRSLIALHKRDELPYLPKEFLLTLPTVGRDSLPCKECSKVCTITSVPEMPHRSGWCKARRAALAVTNFPVEDSVQVFYWLAVPSDEEAGPEYDDNDEQTKVFTYLPPCQWKHLDHTTQLAYSQQQQLHGLRWNDGNIPYGDMHKVLEEATIPDCPVFVYRQESAMRRVLRQNVLIDPENITLRVTQPPYVHTTLTPFQHLLRQVHVWKPCRPDIFRVKSTNDGFAM